MRKFVITMLKIRNYEVTRNYDLKNSTCTLHTWCCSFNLLCWFTPSDSAPSVLPLRLRPLNIYSSSAPSDCPPPTPPPLLLPLRLHPFAFTPPTPPPLHLLLGPLWFSPSDSAPFASTPPTRPIFNPCAGLLNKYKYLKNISYGHRWHVIVSYMHIYINV